MLWDYPVDHCAYSVAILDAELQQMYGELFTFQLIKLCYYTANLERNIF